MISRKRMRFLFFLFGVTCLLAAHPLFAKPNVLLILVDICPTLAELAGLPAPTGPQPIDGVSLAPGRKPV